MQRSDKLATTCLNQFFKKLKAGYVNDIHSLLTDDVEFHVIGRPGVVLFAGIYKGKDEGAGVSELVNNSE